MKKARMNISHSRFNLFNFFVLISLKLRAFWPSYLCFGIPFHSSNWQTDIFYFEDRSYGTLLVHYFQVKF